MRPALLTFLELQQGGGSGDSDGRQPGRIRQPEEMQLSVCLAVKLCEMPTIDGFNREILMLPSVL